MNLTPKQRALAMRTQRFPEKVTGATILTARQLENRGLGSVERWNDGDVLFRLNQAGRDLGPNEEAKLGGLVVQIVGSAAA